MFNLHQRLTVMSSPKSPHARVSVFVTKTSEVLKTSEVCFFELIIRCASRHPIGDGLDLGRGQSKRGSG
jgi:hypothetical protein